MNNKSNFRDAIAATGLAAPEDITTGKIIRFAGLNKPAKNKDAWCLLFEDSLGGVFGDYSSGINSTWQAGNTRNFTQAERDAFSEKVIAARKRKELEEAISQAQAAALAKKCWENAEPCETTDYLTRKSVRCYGLRQDANGDLLVPLINLSGDICSLQTIDTHGEKRFFQDGQIKGNFYLIGNPTDRIIICEGYATAASVHEATGSPVAVAFNCGNLEAVGLSLKSAYPNAALIFGADDDHSKESNQGLTKAREAALTVGGLLAIPSFAEDRATNWTDFNDLHTQEGLDAVRYCFDESRLIDPSKIWPEPIEIRSNLESEPYPVQALPKTIRNAVEEVQLFVKSPVALVACSALANLSIACQPYIDVQRASGLKGPTSLFIIAIAASGERKSSSDGYFSKSIKEFDLQQAEMMKPEIDRYKADHSSWTAKHEAIIANIRQFQRKSKSTASLELDLVNSQNKEPLRPRVPHLLLGDATPEGLAASLAKEWPSAGVLSSEAGLILGAHGMSSESVMRNLGLLNILWDGAPHRITRRTSEPIEIRGARLTMALQVQEEAFKDFYDKSGGLARGIGFFARFLVAFPQSTQGTRFFSEPPLNWPCLEKFNARIDHILHMQPSMTEEYELTPTVLNLSPQAKQRWIEFHDSIEAGLSVGGELSQVRDVASKAADNAARLAALFQMFELGVGDISEDSFDSASSIIAWHLHESRRFLTQLTLPKAVKNLIAIDEWLVRICRQTCVTSIPKNQLRQSGPIRETAELDRVLSELQNLNRLRVIHTRPVTVQVNPTILGRQ